MKDLFAFSLFYHELSVRGSSVFGSKFKIKFSVGTDNTTFIESFGKSCLCVRACVCTCKRAYACMITKHLKTKKK